MRAVVEPERNHLEVLTVDALVEGVHFDRRFTPPDAIGHRALAVNLSDLAAMGARPRLAAAVDGPACRPAARRLRRHRHGVTQLAAAQRIHVVGGNLTRSPGPLIIDVTAIGSAEAARRADARRRAGRATRSTSRGSIGGRRSRARLAAAGRGAAADRR